MQGLDVKTDVSVWTVLIYGHWCLLSSWKFNNCFTVDFTKDDLLLLYTYIFSSRQLLLGIINDKLSQFKILECILCKGYKSYAKNYNKTYHEIFL